MSKGLDFSGWKKTKESEDSTEFQHADGHTMQVRHSALSPQLSKQLKSLPSHMADAGMVGNYDDADMDKVLREQTSGQSSMPNVSGQVGSGGLRDILAPELPPPASPEPQDPLLAGSGAELETAQKALSQQQAANTAEAQATGNIQAAQAPVLSEGAQQQQSVADSIQERAAHIAQVQDRMVKEVTDPENKIKPHDLFNNRQGWDRIKAGIGLFLGGIGGGLSHQENPVLKQLNQEIQNDLHAQEQNQANRLNLVGAMTAALGQDAGAKQAANVVLNDMIAHEVNAQAARLGTPLAMAKAQQANAILESHRAPLNGEAAFRAAMRQDKGGDGAENLIRYTAYKDPKAASALVGRLATTKGVNRNMLSFAQPELRQTMVAGPAGLYYNLGSEKNATTYNDMVGGYVPLLEDIAKLKQVDTLASRVPGSPAYNEAAALRDRVSTQLLALGSSGRLSEVAIGFEKGQFSDPTRIRTLLDNGRSTEMLRKSLVNKMDVTRRQLMPGAPKLDIRKK